ncbi:MAG: NAD(P)/FAD-dependent oxidoreductase, partial [Acidobacteria bacterium]|nr:NAD(P)/FAD-dependent oxidoreductase [Acidobacteriota bacterium]
LPDNGWTPEQISLARTSAADGLERALGDDNSAVAVDVVSIVQWMAGRPLDEPYLAMLLEELALSGDERAPRRRIERSDGEAPVVAVIGAGMSGIATAHRLDQAGIDYVVLEKNADIGGTWLENRYPGCRVDLPNHVYSYSNAQRTDWPHHHSTQDVLRDYFRSCADEWDVTANTRFGVRVESMRWDEDTQQWTLSLSGPDGPDDLKVNAVVSAVGQLNRPKMPDIDGRDNFAGLAFHSSAWPEDLDLTNKRVVVIGTGASAMQFIPHVAAQAAHLTVCQRTPAWLLERPVYHEPISEGLTELFDLLPDYHHWYRLRQFWQIHHGALDALRRDPAWDGPLERAVSPMNDLMRETLTQYLHDQFAERPDLLDQVVPDYPVGAKRFVLDNGIWAETLMRDNVSLVTDPIDEITSDGVVTGGANMHEADVIIYGTGFDASRFLTPMKVIGRDGADLHQRWGDDARAYLGMAIPEFPNLFCLYGPNTNIVFNGSIIFFSECAARYVAETLATVFDEGHRSIEIKRSVWESFVADIDDRNAEMAWGISTVSSWYKSANGRIAQNWPFPLLDYWTATRQPDLEQYVVT